MILQRQSKRYGWVRLIAPLVGFLTLLTALAPAAIAQQPSVDLEPFGVGFFYGTFFESPNTLLLVGGTAEEFCDDNPADPFNGEPGSAVSRTQVRPDGSVNISVHDFGQPIHLYRTDIEGSPAWIAQVCAEYFADGSTPEPFASGLAQLRVRIRIVSEDRIEIFNAASGWARGADGTHYRVTGSADLDLIDGRPVGDPSDFVSFRLQALGRHGR